MRKQILMMRKQILINEKADIKELGKIVSQIRYDVRGYEIK